MGQFRSTFQSPFSAKISDRAHAPAPAKAAAPAPKVPASKLEPAAKVSAAAPAPKVERKTITVPAAAKGEVAARDSRVTHAKKDATAAVRRARWRKKNPGRHATQQRAARARRQEKSQ